jgi:hypothetical protein
LRFYFNTEEERAHLIQFIEEEIERGEGFFSSPQNLEAIIDSIDIPYIDNIDIIGEKTETHKVDSEDEMPRFYTDHLYKFEITFTKINNELNGVIPWKLINIKKIALESLVSDGKRVKFKCSVNLGCPI